MGLDYFEHVLARYGNRFDPEVLESTYEHWSRRVRGNVVPDLPVIADVAYGDHERHRLDLFPVKARGAPVVLFVHGGGFSGGDKQVAPPFYANVGRYFAALGMLGVCMNYRRAPDGGWGAAAFDIELAVQWLVQRADLYGGDAHRIAIVGQSAGACHVATWLFHPGLAQGSRGLVKAAVLMSGYYRVEKPLGPGHEAYFGTDASLYEQRSPLTHARASTQPLLVTLAEHDPPQLRCHTADLVAALTTSGHEPLFADLEGHNHVSPLMSLGSDDDKVGLMLRQFISQATAPKAVDAAAHSAH